MCPDHAVRRFIVQGVDEIHSPVNHSVFPVDNLYIYTIYTPNLGSGIAILGQEREQGCFRGSSEGAWGSTEGAWGSIKGALQGSTKAKLVGALNGSLRLGLSCLLRFFAA